MAAHLVLQVLGGLARRVPAAADIAEHFVGALAAVEALGEQHMQRLVGDLGERVPDRDLDGADADRALGMPAGFLVLHHDGEAFVRRELAGVVEQAVGRCFQDARNETRAHLRAAGVAAGGIEGKAADRLAGAHHVGDHGDHRRRHFAEIEARIGERRLERDRRLADIDDAHGYASARHYLICGIFASLITLAPLLDLFLDVGGEFLRRIRHRVEAELGAFLPSRRAAPSPS